MITTILTRNKKLDLKGIILLSGACTNLKDAMIYQNYLVLEQVKDMKCSLGWLLRKIVKKKTKFQICSLKRNNLRKIIFFIKVLLFQLNI